MEKDRTTRTKVSSVLDEHLDEIIAYRKLELNASAIHKLIKDKVYLGISYNGLLRYIRRKKL